MYTECPNCQTVFRVSAQQLRAAAGQVRCGRCSEVFDALAHRTAWEPESGVEDDPPLTSPPAEVTAPEPDKSRPRKAEPQAPTPQPEVRPASHPKGVETALSGQTRRAFDQPETATAPSRAERRPPFEGNEGAEPGLQRRSAVNAQTATPQPGTKRGSPPESARKPKTAPPDRAKPRSPAAPAPAQTGQDSPRDAVRKPGSAPQRRPAAESQASASRKPKLPSSSNQGADTETGRPQTLPFGTGMAGEPDRDWDPFTEESIEALLRPTDDEPEVPKPTTGAASQGERRKHETVGTHPVTTEPSPPKETRPGPRKVEPAPDQAQPGKQVKPARSTRKEAEAELPLQLQTRSSGSTGVGRTLFWGTGVLLAVAAIGGQYAYFNRDQLAPQAQFRPYLEMLCKVAGCDLPPRRDVTLVEMTDHTVQSHPRREGALLITATLLNGAEFPQPYPRVEVTMMDVEQRPVASRRFTPAEYLAGRNPDALFAAGREVHLVLEVVDPGPQAVSFEFDFH